jgi:hypothetical protein
VTADVNPRLQLARAAGVVDAASGRVQLRLAVALPAQLACEGLLSLAFGLLSQGANRLESEGERSVFHGSPKRSGRVID